MCSPGHGCSWGCLGDVAPDLGDAVELPRKSFMNVPGRKCVTAKRVGGPDCRRAGAVASRNGTDKPGAVGAPRSVLERSNGHIVAIMRHGCVRSGVGAAPKPAADAVGKTAGQAGGRGAGAGRAHMVRAASGDRCPEGTVPAAGAPDEKTVASDCIVTSIPGQGRLPPARKPDSGRPCARRLPVYLSVD